jgi:hypothetical protein
MEIIRISAKTKVRPSIFNIWLRHICVFWRVLDLPRYESDGSHENIVTIALINIHFLYNIFLYYQCSIYWTVGYWPFSEPNANMAVDWLLCTDIIADHYATLMIITLNNFSLILAKPKCKLLVSKLFQLRNIVIIACEVKSLQFNVLYIFSLLIPIIN